MIPLPATSPSPSSAVAADGAQRHSSPPQTLLARPEFAVLPWIVLAVCLVAGALSEWLYGEIATGATADWIAIYGALGGAVLATGLAMVQNLAATRGPRTSAWIYGTGTALVVLGLAALAISTDGLATPYYAGMLPLATYLGLIAPRRARPWLLATLFGVTATVQLANPTSSLFEAAVVWSLILAGWGCGVLGGLEHARLAKIARRLANYDRETRTLNRRAFLEQVDRNLAAVGHQADPIAVLLVDLTGFSDVNARSGERAGDELLQRVGATFSSVLPDDAELGRLGDDRFAVLLPRAPRNEAEAIGHRIRSFLHADVDAAVGIATCQVRSLSPDDLMRVAEAALRVCKEDGVGLHVLVGGSTEAPPSLRAVPAGPTPLRYRQIRETGHVPRAVGTLTLYSWVSTASASVVAACGAVVVAAAWVGGDAGPANDLIRYGGLAWLAWALVLVGLTRIPAFTRPGLPGWFLLANTTAAVVIGTGCAAFADGGLVSALTGGMFVKVLFDAATLPATHARVSSLAVLAGWIVLASVSPTDAQYLIPFQLVLLVGCFVLGAMGQRANRAMAEHARVVGRTDDLTRLPNRAGFRSAAEDAFLDAVTRTAAPYALLWWRVERPARWQAASFAERDRLLRRTADSLAAALPDAHVVGRTGELEFMAAVPRAGRQEALATLQQVTNELGPLSAERSGAAACPQDGATVEALMRAAAGLPPLTLSTPQPQLLTPMLGYPGGPRTDRRLATGD